MQNILFNDYAKKGASRLIEYSFPRNDLIGITACGMGYWVYALSEFYLPVSMFLHLGPVCERFLPSYSCYMVILPGLHQYLKDNPGKVGIGAALTTSIILNGMANLIFGKVKSPPEAKQLAEDMMSNKTPIVKATPPLSKEELNEFFLKKKALTSLPFSKPEKNEVVDPFPSIENNKRPNHINEDDLERGLCCWQMCLPQKV